MELTPVLQTTKAGQPCTLPPAMATITSVRGGLFFIWIQHSSEVAPFCSFCVKAANSGPRACHVCLLEGEQDLPVLGLYWCGGKGVLPPSSLHQGAQGQWHCLVLCWVLLHCCAIPCPCLSKEADELNRSTHKAAWRLPHGPVAHVSLICGAKGRD